MIREAAIGVGVLLGATVFGGVLGGLGDVFAPSLISGTPLGAGSASSPMAWTLIAAVLIIGLLEVRE